MQQHAEFPWRLWPNRAAVRDGRLWLGEYNLIDLAHELQTPLYLYDGETFSAAVDAYRQGLAQWPGSSRIAYAAKAWLPLPFAQLLARYNLDLDVVSAGELGIALAGGVQPEHIHLHGNNKSIGLLREAVRARIGAIVVDNLWELDQIRQLADDDETIPDLWLRLNPALLAPTHPYRQTGHSGSKFGLSREEALTAAQTIRNHPNLRLTGLHTHIGSQIFDLDPMLEAATRLMELAGELHRRELATIRFICPGGGLGAPYHPDDPPIDLAEAVERTAHHCVAAWNRYNESAHPTLILEPGRSLIARAGIALYTVGSVRQLADGKRIVAVDGGMADNLRPALYGVRYTAALTGNPLGETIGPARIVGPLCESGDFLIDEIALPPVQPGDILAIPMSGAYHLSMASNYNGSYLPAAYWLHDDTLIPFQRRQTLADLMQRDIPLSNEI
ncbi:MAG: diaminopimelate decarboxylase [Caldilineales bacterium]|nr:diaminopimelate decarboxylase [Caldilineales bacterium]